MSEHAPTQKTNTNQIAQNLRAVSELEGEGRYLASRGSGFVSAVQLHYAALKCDCGGLGPVLDTEFGEDALQMVLHGGSGHVKGNQPVLHCNGSSHQP